MLLPNNHPFGSLRGKLSCTPEMALEMFGFVMHPDATGVIFRVYRYKDGPSVKTGTFISNYFPPSNPQTPAQQAHRAKMKAAVLHWQGLTPEQRAEWNAKAKKKQRKYAGYQLHNQDFIRKTPPPP